MRIRERLAKWILGPRASLTDMNLRRWIEDSIAGVYPQSSSGVAVTMTNAMRLTAVWGCVRVLSGDLATAPLFVYQRLAEGGRREAREHPLFELLHDAPNARMDSRTWRQLGQKCVELRGNFFNYLDRANGGRNNGAVRQIIPLHPDHVTMRINENDAIVYDYVDDKQRTLRYRPDQILHVMGIPDDSGLAGMSAIRACQNAVGLGMAAEDFMGRFFQNDARPRGVLQVKGKLGKSIDEARRMKAEMRRDWISVYGGENRNGIAVMDNETTYEAISVDPQDAETLGTRKFQVEEIAGRIFGVPPFMIGATEKSTSWGTGLEEQKDGYVTFSLLPRMVGWEQAIHRQLLTPAERSEFFVEFTLDGLLRASIEKRYEAFRVGREGGWLSANDIRRKDNFNPLPAEIGDVYWRPANMMDAGQKIESTTAAKAISLWQGPEAYALARRNGEVS